MQISWKSIIVCLIALLLGIVRQLQNPEKPLKIEPPPVTVFSGK